jgi:hypothetical protein
LVCHATDDDCQATEAAEFRKKLDAMVIAADMKKRYNTARAWVLAATALLEEEQHAAAVLTVEAHAMATLIKTPSPTLPPPPRPGGVAPSDDDHEATVIANVYV